MSGSWCARWTLARRDGGSELVTEWKAMKRPPIYTIVSAKVENKTGFVI